MAGLDTVSEMASKRGVGIPDVLKRSLNALVNTDAGAFTMRRCFSQLSAHARSSTELFGECVRLSARSLFSSDVVVARGAIDLFSQLVAAASILRDGFPVEYLAGISKIRYEVA